MNRFVWFAGAIALVIVIVVALGVSGVIMPGAWRPPRLAAYNGQVPAEQLLRVPVSGIYPGGNSRGLNPDMENPLKKDPDAVARGMRDFDNFNCSGCHMGNGGGGMGPALSNRTWIYRDSPANIYLSIAQGRSAGMPAFGAMLPDRTIWELVAYIQSLSDSPDRGFGTTTSATPEPPSIEQVPVGQVQSPTPWKFTETMPPNGEKNGGPVAAAPGASH
ncbi:MAG TPA: cytochrome c [Rhizomicrobium sp.]|nr:cytochrome c [Rhizomicrobium sp.]